MPMKKSHLIYPTELVLFSSFFYFFQPSFILGTVTFLVHLILLFWQMFHAWLVCVFIFICIIVSADTSSSSYYSFIFSFLFPFSLHNFFSFFLFFFRSLLVCRLVLFFFAFLSCLKVEKFRFHGC